MGRRERELLVEFLFERILVRVLLLWILLVLRRIIVLVRWRGVRFQLTRGSWHRMDGGRPAVWISAGRLLRVRAPRRAQRSLLNT
ncbi:hypothetical protein AMK16_18895 [Streptomyces sp. CB00455]|nr:hypothetical protein AMK16_18895 [Streptomyces sp. CB00455]